MLQVWRRGAQIASFSVPRYMSVDKFCRHHSMLTFPLRFCAAPKEGARADI